MNEASYLLVEYRRHRAQGHSHNGALKALARRFNLDLATAGRVIERAEHDEAAPRATPQSTSARADS